MFLPFLRSTNFSTNSSKSSAFVGSMISISSAQTFNSLAVFLISSTFPKTIGVTKPSFFNLTQAPKTLLSSPSGNTILLFVPLIFAVNSSKIFIITPYIINSTFLSFTINSTSSTPDIYSPSKLISTFFEITLIFFALKQEVISSFT